MIFDFSNFDQSVSKIIRIIFDPNNGGDLQKITSHFYNGSITYPVLSSIKATYYPSDSFYTFYYPNFHIFYKKCFGKVIFQLGIPAEFQIPKLLKIISKFWY